jgi:hypothetical protein
LRDFDTFDFSKTYSLILTQTVSATDIAIRQPSNAFESSKHFTDTTSWNSLQTVSATDIALRRPSNAFESSKYFTDTTSWNSLQIGKSEKMHFLDITPLSTNWLLRHRLECLHIWSFLVASIAVFYLIKYRCHVVLSTAADHDSLVGVITVADRERIWSRW